MHCKLIFIFMPYSHEQPVLLLFVFNKPRETAYIFHPLLEGYFRSAYSLAALRSRHAAGFSFAGDFGLPRGVIADFRFGCARNYIQGVRTRALRSQFRLDILLFFSSFFSTVVFVSPPGNKDSLIVH